MAPGLTQAIKVNDRQESRWLRAYPRKNLVCGYEKAGGLAGELELKSLVSTIVKFNAICRRSKESDIAGGRRSG